VAAESPDGELEAAEWVAALSAAVQAPDVAARPVVPRVAVPKRAAEEPEAVESPDGELEAAE
jgi:hypothetical protein